ncbi:MAG: hypothetical protein KGS47_11955 [Chloroflexi bacterium]|nr:hypothetical protein [Chloroflexota bacterium]
MTVEVAPCPACGQPLAIQAYLPTDARVVCANERCGATLRIATRRPLRYEHVPTPQTFTAASRPESYG